MPSREIRGIRTTVDLFVACLFVHVNEMTCVNCIFHERMFMIINQNRLACTVDEAVLWSTLNRHKIYDLINAGVLRSSLVGRRKLINMDSLRRVIDEGSQA